MQLEVDSLCGTEWGEDSQLLVHGKVVGTSSPILFAVTCKVCSPDKELFPDEYFLVPKSHLKRGTLPCGCSKAPKWTLDQWLIRLQRKASSQGVVFNGMVGKYIGGKTIGNFICPNHGSQPKTFTDFMNGRVCKECRVEKTKQATTKPDSEMIASFFDSGAFHPETKFWRSERLTPRERYRFGVKSHWNYLCGFCGETGESLASTLRKGGMSCKCSMHKQTVAYIYLVKDNDQPLFLKYGITKSAGSRREEFIRRGTPFDIELIIAWKFENSISCQTAEKAVKKAIRTFPVSKNDFQDGYTETAYISDMENIMNIFKEFGGEVCK